jgi:hypothetical protein
LRGNEVVIHVQARRARPLKTRSSRRVVIGRLADEEARLLGGFLSERDRAHGDAEELFSRQLGRSVPQIRRFIGEGIASLGRGTIPSIASRSHAFRHRFATTWGLQLLGQLSEKNGVDISIIEDWGLDQLPARVRYQYGSRRLGHGTPETTLCWYDHSLALRQDAQSLKMLGSPVTLEWMLTDKVSLHRGTHRQRQITRFLRDDIHCFPANKEWQSRPSNNFPPVLSREAGRYRLIAETLLSIQKYGDLNVTSAVLGVPVFYVAAMKERAQQIQQEYGIPFLSNSTRDTASNRLPLAWHAVPLLDEFDRLIRADVIQSFDVCSWLLSAMAKRGGLAARLSSSSHADIDGALKWFARLPLKRGSALTGHTANFVALTVLTADHEFKA